MKIKTATDDYLLEHERRENDASECITRGSHGCKYEDDCLQSASTQKAAILMLPKLIT